MLEIIREAVHDPDAAWELCRMKKDPAEIVSSVTGLERDEAVSLGNNFKQFPLGCDLTEIFVGTCASDMEKIDILGNCQLSDAIGASIHVCAYAFADIAEAHGMKGIDLYREVRELTEVPLDLDHFGSFGPMRLPKDIIGCQGQCYNTGPPFSGCPRDRIHSRLLDKEKEAIADREEWVKISSSVAVNVSCVQGAQGHAAPLEEAREIAELAIKFGKVVEAILFVGDGDEDLLRGFTAALELGADVFVIEGGPFNCAKNRLDAFARAVAAARILAPGKVVATNGAYEDECRIGLRAGLNAIITGFPKNHHGYMCGYAPGTARRGNFGLPRVLRIIREEVRSGQTRAPIMKEEVEALARAVKIVGPEHVYPEKIGDCAVGDAHWVCLQSTPLYRRVRVGKTAADISAMAKEGLLGDTVALLGGRFVSWVLARELEGYVDRIIISDTDPRVENVTVENLRSALRMDIEQGGSDDLLSSNRSDTAIVCSTIPSINRKISLGVRNPISLL